MQAFGPEKGGGSLTSGWVHTLDSMALQRSGASQQPSTQDTKSKKFKKKHARAFYFNTELNNIKIIRIKQTKNLQTGAISMPRPQDVQRVAVECIHIGETRKKGKQMVITISITCITIGLSRGTAKLHSRSGLADG